MMEEENEEEKLVEDEEDNEASDEEEIGVTPSTPFTTSGSPLQRSLWDNEWNFSSQEEEAIVHWISQHVALYNTAESSWKGRNTRQEIIQVKANDMGG